MITLSLLQHLSDEGFGIIDTDLFFQKLTLDKKGLYISNIGAPGTRGQRKIQPFEILSRGSNDLDGYLKLQAVMNYLEGAYGKVCNLPDVAIPVTPFISPGYQKVTIQKPSTITNVGLDANNRTIYSITGSMIY